VLILRTMAGRWRAAGVADAEVPYGPRETAPTAAPPSPRGAR
jgi:hypothetical protein